MSRLTILAMGLLLGSAATAWGQAVDTPYQVRAVSKLKKNDLINLTNTGATNATMCAHVYAFDTAGQFLACCSCLVAPNTLASVTVGHDVLADRKPFPKAAVFNVVASQPSAGVCDGRSVGTLVQGLLVSKGDTPFSPSTLSAGEFAGLMARCSFLHTQPSACGACEISTL